MKQVNKKINTLLNSFSKINLLDAQSVKLFKRVDTKFILNAEMLPELIATFPEYFHILEVNNSLDQQYISDYYDTQKFDFYYKHHNQVLPRVKVRSRTYLNSGVKFLEVKLKNNKEITEKVRSSIDLEEAIDFNKLQFNLFEPNFLRYKLSVAYKRITFINRKSKERITIDYNLRFYNSENEYNLPKLAIVELKQEKHKISLSRKLLNQSKLTITPFSKYCYGCNLLFPQLRFNLFKERNALVNRIINQTAKAINY